MLAMVSLLGGLLVPAGAAAGSTTATTLSAAATTVLVGAPASLAVTVSSGGGVVPTGTVIVSEGGAEVGRCGLASGTCTVVVLGLTPGGHALVAAYGGDAANDPSVSDPLVLSANAGIRGTTAAATTLAAGQTSLSVPVPTGTRAGDLLVASVAVGGGSATTIGAPGWTRLGGADLFSGTTLKHGLFWRIRTADESASTVAFTFGTSQRASATLVAVAGASGAAPLSVGTVNASSALVTTPTVTLGASPMLGLPLAFVAVALGTSVTGMAGGYSRIATISSSGKSGTLTTSIAAAARPAIGTAATGATMTLAAAAVTIGATVVVPFPPVVSVTRLASSAQAAVAGQGVTYTARVDPSSATGWVSFTADGATPIGRCQLVAGACATAPVALAVGTHTVVAAYEGVDGVVGTSASTPYAATVDLAPTTLTVRSSANPADHGTPVELAIAVGSQYGGAAPPTGEIVVSEGPYRLGTCQAVGGACTVPISPEIGSHELLVSYLGDASYQLSGLLYTQRVVPATTTTTVRLVPASGGFGTSFSAVITTTTGDGVATGTVAISDGTTGVATCILVSDGTAGSCSATLGRLAVGSHAIVASYGGDAFRAPSVGRTSLTVTRATSTLAAGGTPNPAPAGTSVAIAATVTTPDGVPPTGTIAFSDGTTRLGSCTLPGTIPATCSITASGLTIGDHQVSASYGGDPLHAPVLVRYVQTIGRYASTVAATNTPSSTTYGGSVAVAVKVTATVGTPTGAVTLSDGTTGDPYGRCDLTTGAACTIRTTAILGGTRTLLVTYLGNATIAPGTTRLTQVVARAATSTALGVVAGRVYGEPTTLTATVSPATATGSVVFSDGTTTYASCPLVAGTCSTQAILPAGVTPVAASYVGDGNYLPSASASSSISILPTATVTTVATSGDSGYGGELVLTVAVTPRTATGTVTFAEGGVAIGTCELTASSGGTCAWIAPTLALGDHAIGVSYGGDANHVSSQTAVTVTIVRGSTRTIVSSSAQDVAYAANVLFTATVEPSLATGTVTFWDDATQIGSCSLTSASGGRCSMLTGALAVGTHPITARYLGSALLLPSVSAPIAQRVGVAATTTTLATSANPSTAGTGSATIAVSPAAASGSATLLDGGVAIGTCPLVSGSCTISLAGLAPGTHQLSAAYAGEGAYGPSASGIVTQVVSVGVRAVTAASNGAGATTLAITVPATVAAGDLLLAAVTIASSTATIAPPAGWSRLGTDVVWSAGALTQGLFARVATSGDAARIAAVGFGATVKASAALIAIAGAAPSLPEAVAGQLNSIAVPQIYTPALATSGARGLAVLFGGMALGTTFASAGTGYTLPVGGQAASSGGKTSSQTTTGLAYGVADAWARIVSSQLNTSASVGAMNIGHVVFVTQAP